MRDVVIEPSFRLSRQHAAILEQFAEFTFGAIKVLTGHSRDDRTPKDQPRVYACLFEFHREIDDFANPFGFGQITHVPQNQFGGISFHWEV